MEKVNETLGKIEKLINGLQLNTISLADACVRANSLVPKTSMRQRRKWLEYEAYGYPDGVMLGQLLCNDNELVKKVASYRQVNSKLYIGTKFELFDIDYPLFLWEQISIYEFYVKRAHKGEQFRLSVTIPVNDQTFPPKVAADLIKKFNAKEVTVYIDKIAVVNLVLRFKTEFLDFLTTLQIEIKKTIKPPTKTPASLGDIQTGDINAQNVFVGHRNVITISNEPALVEQAFSQLKNIAIEKEHDKKILKSIIQRLDKLQVALTSNGIREVDSAKITKELVKKAPWLKSKLKKLLLDIAKSSIGGAVIEGIKSAL